MKKLIKIIILLLVMISPLQTFAQTTNELQVIKESSEKKYLENDQGYISKNIVESNKDTGEITIEVTLANISKLYENLSTTTEIFLVVDNSPSMDFVTASGETRKDIILNSASQLVESIFNLSNNVKIGLVDFHGVNGWLDYASIYNANLVQKLTDDKDKILTAITNQLNKETVGGTNIDAGLQMAAKNFSENSANKIIILLSDGVPNADCEGNNSSNDVTEEEAITIQETTKNTILSLKEKGIYTITMLTGIYEEDGNTDKDGTIYEDVNTIEEELAAVEKIFGTIEKPNADKYYLVNSTNVNEVITKDILEDVSEKINSPMKEVIITDYFPIDIKDNFDFSYVETPSLGTVSPTIDEESNSIVWNIGELKGNETTSLKYKLKIKDINNEELIDKVISTNEKIVLDYKDSNDESYNVILDSSPQIKLVKIQESESFVDETIENPKTGYNLLILLISLIVSSGLVIKIRKKKDFIKKI